jgi:hypothetical protein
MRLGHVMSDQNWVSWHSRCPSRCRCAVLVAGIVVVVVAVVVIVNPLLVVVGAHW